jgi:4'-phosphopantetheinyl transferase
MTNQHGESDYLPGQHLTEADLHVWCASLEQPAEVVEKLEATLSTEESTRAERFRFAQHRRFFITSRGILRNLLSRYLEIEPGQIELEYTQTGKPHLPSQDGSAGISFNLSHSGNWVIYAFTRNRQVGVDIETIHSIEDMDLIARRNFSREEYEDFRSTGEADRMQAFFNCWTRKEAFIKAIGDGLLFPLQEFTVSLMPGKSAKLLSVSSNDQEAARWSVLDIQVADGYAAALVVEGSGFTILQREWFLSSR